MAQVHWTHSEDLKNVYGVGADGYARMTLDNVGVQYGLEALKDGNITPAEFLDVNARIGSWKDPADMVQEAFPFPAPPPPMPPRTPGFDPWSARNMNLSPDGGVTPAPRREGDISAMNAAYNKGLYFDGDIDIPLIDWRHYLEEELDMHNSHQSFASRQRMLDFDGDASNQVIWFTDARPARQVDATPEALAVIDQWMANIRAHPDLGVAGNKPELATDRCFTTQGAEIARGPDVWGGILDGGPKGVVRAGVPAPLDLADRRRRPAAGRRLQVRAAVGRRGDRERRVRLLDAVGDRGRPAQADLPDRGLRLQPGRRRPALILGLSPYASSVGSAGPTAPAAGA